MERRKDACVFAGVYRKKDEKLTLVDFADVNRKAVGRGQKETSLYCLYTF